MRFEVFVRVHVTFFTIRSMDSFTLQVIVSPQQQDGEHVLKFVQGPVRQEGDEDTDGWFGCSR